MLSRLPIASPARQSPPAGSRSTEATAQRRVAVSVRQCALAGGGKLFAAGRAFPVAASRTVELPATRPAARRAELVLRFGPVALARPGRTVERDLPASVALTLVEVEEADPPAGVEPVHWRLLTTHAVADAAAAWRVAGWYKARWTIG